MMTKQHYDESPSGDAIGRVTVSREAQVRDFNSMVNPLIVASAPLLSLATELREQTDAPNLNQLHNVLYHEIRTFEHKIHSLNYPSTVVLASRYFLCALIDEIIATSSWGQNNAWQDQVLLKPLQEEAWNGERFFLILERSCEHPRLHIDLLELAYLCLSLGYEGEYRYKPQGHRELIQLIDKLYYLIRDERGEFSRKLLVPNKNVRKPSRILRYLPPVWMAVMVAVLGLVISYIPYRIYLDKLTTPVYQTVKNLRR